MTLNRNVAPSRTRGGTSTCTGWAAATSPRPPQAAHHSVQTSPRPPQRPQVRRSGTSNGTVTPSNASRARQHHLRRQRDRRLGGEEGVAHAVEHARHRREVDGDFVGEPRLAAAGAAAADADVVVAAARRIAQHVVGARQLLERGPAIVARDVGMIAARQLPVGPLDFLGARIGRDAEHLVVVTHTPVRVPAERVPSFSSEVNTCATPRRPAQNRDACYNPAMKECPLCGETMRLSVRELRDHIPGTRASRRPRDARVDLPGMRLFRGSGGRGGVARISGRRGSTAARCGPARRSPRNSAPSHIRRTALR